MTIQNGEMLNLRVRVEILEGQNDALKNQIKSSGAFIADLHERMERKNMELLAWRLCAAVFAGYFLWVMI
jgi:hypothetical protein